jgi:hypothetical protein
MASNTSNSIISGLSAEMELLLACKLGEAYDHTIPTRYFKVYNNYGKFEDEYENHEVHLDSTYYFVDSIVDEPYHQRNYGTWTKRFVTIHEAIEFLERYYIEIPIKMYMLYEYDGREVENTVHFLNVKDFKIYVSKMTPALE